DRDARARRAREAAGEVPHRDGAPRAEQPLLQGDRIDRALHASDGALAAAHRAQDVQGALGPDGARASGGGNGPTRGDSAVNCNRILKRLDLYAGGDLAGREAAEVELHLRGCLSCYREYVAQRDLLETVRGAGGIEPRGDAERETLVAGVMRRID